MGGKRHRNGLSVAQQAIGIRRNWPDQEHPRVARGILTWHGRLRPSALSPSYAVSLTYQRGQPPAVYVVDPDLDAGHREQLPHVYDDDRLCLYTPGEWREHMSIAETILPWTSVWLLHYELWHATGHWDGGGHVYAPTENRDQEAALHRKLAS